MDEINKNQERDDLSRLKKEWPVWFIESSQCSCILMQNINFTSTLIFDQEDVKITSRSYWPSFGFTVGLVEGLRNVQGSVWCKIHCAGNVDTRRADGHVIWPIVSLGIIRSGLSEFVNVMGRDHRHLSSLHVLSFPICFDIWLNVRCGLIHFVDFWKCM